MKISELDYDKLTEEDMYNLIMSGLVDYEGQKLTDETKSDIIVVLGCSPRPLKARIKKMMALQRAGYSNKVLLSGGRGWQKLVKQNPERRPELIQAIKDVIASELLGDNPQKVELDTYAKFVEQMQKLTDGKYKAKSYQEKLDDSKFEMTEEEFMKLIIITNGGVGMGVKMYHEPFSTNTKENTFYIGKVFKNIERETGKKIDRAMIVTSAYHCTRSRLTLKKAYPEMEFLMAPSTEDLAEYGIDISPKMMEIPKYHKQIIGEAKRIIEYSKKGDIQDVELTELVSKEVADDIETRQRQVKREDEGR